MNKSELKNEVRAMLVSGRKRSEVFNELKNEAGVWSLFLARFINAYPDPQRVKKYRWLVWALIAVTMISLFFDISKIYESEHIYFRDIISISLSVLLVVGFYKNWLIIYKAFIFINIFVFLCVWGYILYSFASNFSIRTPFAFYGMEFFFEVGVIGVIFITSLFWAARIFLTFYVMKKIFPDAGLFGSRKVEDRYVFTESDGKQVLV